MNESKNSPRPSLICRVVRQWESSQGPADGNGQTWVAERHMETCDVCQAFFAEDGAFEEMMRGAARVEMHAGEALPDAGFDLRILQAVRESVPEPESVRESRGGRVRSFGFSLAAVAAGVALALVVAQREVTPENGGPVVAVDGGDETTVAGESLTVVAADWLDSVDARGSALEMVRRNPLEEEIESISTDARSVIGFLAMNFLPSEQAEKVLEKPRGAAGQG
jgi:hypothetical protein